jgi:hypothetical protein
MKYYGDTAAGLAVGDSLGHLRLLEEYLIKEIK